jgi:hypothetical protein
LNGWVAYQFEKNQKKLEKTSSDVDVSEGSVLLDLLEVLLGRRVFLPPASDSASSRDRRLANLSACLDQLKKEAPHVFGSDISAAGSFSF